MYDCETLPVSLSEKHILRVFEKGVLVTIFGLKKDEVIGG
jgi:hypothetical protein